MDSSVSWSIGLLATGSVILLLGLTFLIYQLWRRRRARTGLEYQNISGVIAFPKPPGSIPGDKITATAIGHNQPICGMKTIPFTVPPVQTPPVNRRSDSRVGLLDETLSQGSDTSSLSSKRPSVELSGAYALGTIDPSLYKMADEDDIYEMPAGHIGRVWFAVEYERESEKLLVTVIKARNLPSRSMSTNNACDPFVRIYLMPDERRFLQSKSKRKTCNPKFQESFVFQLPHKSFDERVLKLSVYDVDRHRRHVVVGHAVYPLKEHDSENNERVVIWRDLEREVAESSDIGGEVEVSLMYNDNLERLTVGVFDGKSFKVPEGNSTIETYMKVSLSIQSKIIKTKKTDVIKRTTSPEFNESFTFKLPAASLDMASVNITAMQQCGAGIKDRPIGRVVLGCFMFSRGKELEHWNEMISSMRQQVSHWHVLT